MLLLYEEREALTEFFGAINLRDRDDKSGKDKAAKIGQVLAYLEVMHSELRKLSKKRDLVLVDSGAGNCYLAFLLYHFYTTLEGRGVVIHCVDTNARLMEKARQRAARLGFEKMHFHACDIGDFCAPESVDAVYSLHACDSATDKTLHLGIRAQARAIFSVSCCQHTVKKQLRSHPYSGITKHSIYKDKITYMVADSLRALLVEMQGYEVGIFEFASSRYTDKNVMMRARRGNPRNRGELGAEYQRLRGAFHLSPPLEGYLEGEQAFRVRSA
jgi:SAM-dependent methyltransferase